VKIQYALPLTSAVGLGFGAVAIRGLHARTTTPPVYLVVEVDEVTDAMALRLSAKRPRLPLWKSNLRTVAISRVQKM
jgi:hypothetical protein